MTVLKKYGIHEQLWQLPRVLQAALPLLGVQEVVGKGSNKTILAWRDELNAAFGLNPNAAKISGYSDDDIPWCGLFQAHVYFRAGKKVVPSPLWARNWAKAGVPVAERVGDVLRGVDGRVPSLGDTLVFVRDGGGHVGTYIAEDAHNFAVLGGNQSNAVTITKISKSRCIAVRRPEMRNPPASCKPVKVRQIVGTRSKNEA